MCFAGVFSSVSDGKRIKKKVYGSNGAHLETVVFVYSGGKLVAEYSTKAPTSPKIKYLTEDHLGTPRIITNGLGAVESRRDFLPFGEEIGSTVGARNGSGFGYTPNGDDVRQKFTGYQKDEESQLDFAEARMYENRHGRFTAVDPLLASGNSANPQTFNRFAYVGSDPMNRTDPLGEIWYMEERTRLRRDGSTYKTFQPIWYDGTRYDMKRWDKGVYKVREGANRGQYIAVDPWNPKFSVHKSQEAALEAYNGYLSQVKQDAAGGAVHALSDAADCVITSLLCITGYAPTPMRNAADNAMSENGINPDESSDAYRVGYRGTNAMMAVASGTRAVGGMTGTAAKAPVLTKALYGNLIRTQKNSLSWIARSIQKHSIRPGSAYSVSSRTHQGYRQAGQEFTDELLNSADAVSSPNRFGGVDIRLPDGRGIRFKENGEPYSLLEP